MNILSIFVDESGDFGKYEKHSPYYILSLVFHNQKDDIKETINTFEQILNNIGFPNILIHTGPIIREEKEYKQISLENRKKLIRITKTFINNLNIKYSSFKIDKKELKNKSMLIDILTKQLSNFIKDKFLYFNSFDKIIIYYDKGQLQLNIIIMSVFNSLLDNVEFRIIKPKDYRLFQVADYICSMTLYDLKKDNLTKSEKYFFRNKHILNKQYIKNLKSKKFK